MAAFWSLAILIFYGCLSLRAELAGRFADSMGARLWEGGRIPVIGVDVTPAFLIALVVFAGAMILLYRWTESPKIADALIETESELRKVTWPEREDTLRSSLIVIGCTFVIAGSLAFYDFVWGRLTGIFLFTEG